MTKKKMKVQPQGVKKLAVWMAAETTAAVVLDVLVGNGTITSAQKIANLEAATLAVLGERQWENIFAIARANSSNESAKEISARRREELFAWLDQNYNSYGSLDALANAALDAKVTTWAWDQVRKKITEYKKQKLPNK